MRRRPWAPLLRGAYLPAVAARRAARATRAGLGREGAGARVVAGGGADRSPVHEHAGLSRRATGDVAGVRRGWRTRPHTLGQRGEVVRVSTTATVGERFAFSGGRVEPEARHEGLARAHHLGERAGSAFDDGLRVDAPVATLRSVAPLGTVVPERSIRGVARRGGASAGGEGGREETERDDEGKSTTHGLIVHRRGARAKPQS